MSLKLLFHFFIGFFLGCFIVLSPFIFSNDKRWKIAISKPSRKVSMLYESFESELDQRRKVFDDTLALQLFNEVKILCMVMTHPENHQLKAFHIQETWGKRCNKLIFVTSKADSTLENLLILNMDESRDGLWNKTKSAFNYAHDNFINDFHFFMKADDDNYIILENLRQMLYQYNPDGSYYFGHRYRVDALRKGYMAGGGYVLSRQAVKDFVKVVENHPEKCAVNASSEDWEMGRCLTDEANFIDCRDEMKQKRFFPITIMEHLMPESEVSMDWWYRESLYYQVQQGSLNCCSDTPISFHYIPPKLLYRLEYLIYKVSPFGYSSLSGGGGDDEKLPEKLSSNEIF